MTNSTKFKPLTLSALSAYLIGLYPESASQATALATAGASLQFALGAKSVSIAMPDGTTLATVGDVPMSLAVAAMSGTANPDAKMLFVARMVALLKDAHAALMALSTSKPVIPALAISEPAIPSEPVRLRDAVALGQKVLGTSATSVYRVIALLPDLKVAARIKGSAIALRAEGDFAKYKDRLTAAGFTIGEKHASVHAAVPPGTGDVAKLAVKTVGALLFSLGVRFDSVVSSASVAQKEVA